MSFIYFGLSFDTYFVTLNFKFKKYVRILFNDWGYCTSKLDGK
jgi:hypothetical protein